MGDDATKQAVLARLAAAPVVHIATHGFVDEDSGATALLLRDGHGGGAAFLDKGDLSRLTLTARLAVLPACHSGRGKQWRGEGPVGLGRALLASGAPTLVLSLWSLHDRASERVMRGFYDALLQDAIEEDASEAASLLREAVLQVFSGEGELRRRWMDWGALQVRGAGLVRLPRLSREVREALADLRARELMELRAATEPEAEADHRVIPTETSATWHERKLAKVQARSGCSAEEAERALGVMGWDLQRACALLGTAGGAGGEPTAAPPQACWSAAAKEQGAGPPALPACSAPAHADRGKSCAPAAWLFVPGAVRV